MNTLIVRGMRTVELRNVTCKCHVGIADIRITNLALDSQTLPSVVITKSGCINTSATGSCTTPTSCEGINQNVFTLAQLITGTFNHSAVIECRNKGGDSNRATPLIVWVEVQSAYACSQNMTSALVPGGTVVIGEMRCLNTIKY